MAAAELASVIITNHNYGRFLRESIDSALDQTCATVEVIVDGSTDDSREIIARYGDRITPVLKANGGMGSAVNAGFAASRGHVICFLDADDTLLPTAMEQAVELFDERNVAKVHWPLWITDEAGHRTGGIYPARPLPEGDLRDNVIRFGPSGYTRPMTTGNAWARSFLERVLPMPEEEYRGAAESYLTTLAPACGLVRKSTEPLATYRCHTRSLSNRRSLAEQMKSSYRRRSALQRAFRRMGIEVDAQGWPPSAGERQQMILACEELASVLSSGSSFIFVEWEQWGPGQIVPGCRQIPFLERDGQYWGHPPDDASAISELERLRRSGAGFIVFAAPALWWLEYYSGLHDHLRSGFRCLLENDRLVVFDLRSKA